MALPRPITRHVTAKEVAEKSVIMCEKGKDYFYHTRYNADPDISHDGTLYKVFSVLDKNNHECSSYADFVPVEEAVNNINHLIDIANNNPERAIVRWGSFLFNNQKEFDKRFNKTHDSMKGHRTRAPSKKSCPVKVNVRKMF